MKALEKIIYIEDQEDIQAIAQVALSSISHYEVKLCSSGQAALEVIEDFAPDLILLDVMMPGMDGPQTLEAIRKLDSQKDVPVVFMTAKVLPREIDDLMALGALGVISKPFDPVTLGQQVGDIWHKQSPS